jgi:acetolactate synthase-1/2/3 large subunit
VLPPGHPLSIGSTLPQAPALAELKEADVVLAVGTELGETDTLLFDRRLELGGRLIRIDIDPGQLTANAVPALAIVSDARLALAALTEAMNGAGDRAAAGSERARLLNDRLEQLLSDDQRLHRRVMNAVQEALPEVVVVGDSTQLVYSANLFYAPERPRLYFNSSTGYGTLGYALPAAFGARLACPGRPVLSVIGDGGLQFTVGELAAGVEAALGVPVLLWNNRGYGEIKRYMVDRSIPAIGVDIYTPDLLAIARGYGCHAHRAGRLDELQERLAEAGRATVPTVVEVDEDTARSW